MSSLEQAARAVVERWDTPLWKDAPATALYINALREALEQSRQEMDPVVRNGWVLREVLFDNGEPVGHREPQPARQPLTEAQIAEALIDLPVQGTGYFLRIARAIEAAHGIKGGPHA